MSRPPFFLFAVFSLLEGEGPSDDGSTASILKGAFKSALAQVLRAVKGEVAKTCDQLAQLAEKKIKEKEAAGEVAEAVTESPEDEFGKIGLGVKQRTRALWPVRLQ